LNATTEIGRWMLVGLTSAIAVGVAFWMGKEKNRIDQVALGMVLGGALGNILDRTRHGFVVDFADLHLGEWRPFLIFNVGDAAISIAVVILLLRAFLSRKDQAKGSSPKEIHEDA
jgi:signal peptidase II